MVWLDVGGDVRDARFLEVHESILDGVSDAVARFDGDCRIDFEVDIDEYLATASPHDEGLNIPHGGVGADGVHDGLGLGIFEASIHQLIQGRPDNTIRIVADEEGDQ